MISYSKIVVRIRPDDLEAVLAKFLWSCSALLGLTGWAGSHVVKAALGIPQASPLGINYADVLRLCLRFSGLNTELPGQVILYHGESYISVGHTYKNERKAFVRAGPCDCVRIASDRADPNVEIELQPDGSLFLTFWFHDPQRNSVSGDVLRSLDSIPDAIVVEAKETKPA